MSQWTDPFVKKIDDKNRVRRFQPESICTDGAKDV